MKRLLCALQLSLLSILTLGLVACPSGGGAGNSEEDLRSEWESEFSPPSGAAEAPEGGQNGPWSKRLLLAKSEDGIHFVRTGQIVTDQGDAPTMILDQRGWIFLYYMAWEVGEENNVSAVAVSQDQGETWIFKKIEVSGVDWHPNPSDPVAHVLADGTFRLYFSASSPDEQIVQTYYAEGTDGIHFENKGVAFSVENQSAISPCTIQTGDSWHLFTIASDKQTSNYHGSSVDGTDFTLQGGTLFEKENQLFHVGNGLAFPDGYRLYAFRNHTEKVLASFFSIDGETWTADEGETLAEEDPTGLEATGLNDPAVVQLSDGTYLMVYVAGIP